MRNPAASEGRGALSAQTVEEYLGSVSQEQREALEALRAVIKAAAPEATEGVSYGVPGFKQDGVLVSYGAGKNHCAFYVQSPAVVEAFASELDGYKTSKGSVRFQPGEPLPQALVTRIVHARIAENLGRKAARKKSQEPGKETVG